MKMINEKPKILRPKKVPTETETKINEKDSLTSDKEKILNDYKIEKENIEHKEKKKRKTKADIEIEKEAEKQAESFAQSSVIAVHIGLEIGRASCRERV